MYAKILMGVTNVHAMMILPWNKTNKLAEVIII